MQEQILYMHQQ